MALPSAVSIVVPAFNEEDAVAALVADLRAAAPWHEIVVVDDGSTDATAERAEQAASKAPPEMARALRRSAHSMVYNLERALEVLQKENRRSPRPPVTYS